MFASVVTLSERNRDWEGGGEVYVCVWWCVCVFEGGQRRGCEGNRLAVKYCGVCQLHHDVLGITRSLITLN